MRGLGLNFAKGMLGNKNDFGILARNVFKVDAVLAFPDYGIF